MRAIIFCAGLGTRFKPWTDSHPKALAVVNGKSLLQRNIEYLQRYNITEVVVNVHHFADQIENAIGINDGWGSEVLISDERNEVLETGGGLKKAAALIDNDDFVAINVDILTDLDLDAMKTFHKANDSLATVAVTTRNTSRYFLFDGNSQLCGWRNVKTGEEKWSRASEQTWQKAFSGVHVISPRLFPLMNQVGKFSIVDVYLDVSSVHNVIGFDHTGSRLIDVGKPESVALAEVLFP